MKQLLKQIPVSELCVFSKPKSIRRAGSLLFFITSVITLLYSCATHIGSTQSNQLTPPLAFLPKNSSQISVMAMNVENLFDTAKDPGKEDYAYLPKTQKTTAQHIDFCNGIKNNRFRDDCLNLDWNEDVLKVKMKNLADVVLDIDGGLGPDILMLSEVENEKVLKQWRDDFLPQSQYKTAVLIEGADQRGIDVAVLTRLELARAAELVPIDAKFLQDSDKARINSLRQFLIVPLKLEHQVLNIIVGHLPSQANPHSQRVAAILTLQKIVEKIEQRNELFIAGGDFNITSEEDLKSGLLSKTAASFSQVSHFVGCKLCPGTHNYREDWSFLDVLLFSKKFTNEKDWKLDTASIDVIRYNPVHLKFDSPKRFNEETRTGVSDHFPIYARIYKNKPSEK